MLGGGLHNAGQPSEVRTTLVLALAVVVCLAASPTITAARANGVVGRAAISLTSNPLHRIRGGKSAAVGMHPDLDPLSDPIPRDGAVAAGVAAAAASDANVADVNVITDDVNVTPIGTITTALGWPDDWPHGSDSDVELLPVRSGDIIGLRAKDLDLFCNVRDLSVNIPSTTTNAATALRSALVCGEQSLGGPGGSLLVIGANFLSDGIEADKGTFYIKSQRANNFCGVMPASSLGLLADDDGGIELDEDGADLGPSGVTLRRRRQEGRLVVTCDKVHYDDTCEWRASVSRNDPRVIFLHPANPPSVDAASAANRGGLFTCAPRGREGLMVCDEGHKPQGRKAEMEVVKAGYRPDGGDDGGNPYYPGGGDDDGGNPYYPGGGGGYLETTGELLEPRKDKAKIGDDAGNPYNPGGGGDDGGDPYYPGGGGGHSGKGKRGKLPFRTGAMVRIVSPRLDSVCDTAERSSPYGPGGAVATAVHPIGGASHANDVTSRSAISILGRRGGGSSSSTSSDRNSNLIDSRNPYSPYDYGGDDDDDVMASVVWCNASVPDSGPHDYPSWGAATAIAAAAASDTATGGSSSDGNTQGSKWDLDGYVLMGTDFTTADLYDGSRVYLKNQNTRKFCRVTEDRVSTGVTTATAAADTAVVDDNTNNNKAATSDLSRHHSGRDGRSHEGAWPLVCDRTTSGRETELVLELVEVEAAVEKQWSGAEAREGSGLEREGGNEDSVLDESTRSGDVDDAGGHDKDELERQHHERDEQYEQDEQDRRRERHHKRIAGIGGTQQAAESATTVGNVHRLLKDGVSISSSQDVGKAGSSGGYWPPGGGGGKKTSVLVRLRAPGNDMRYCAPQRSLPGAPITCNLPRADPKRRGVTTFRLVDAVTPYASDSTTAVHR